MMPRTSRVPAGSRPFVGSSRTTSRRGSSSAAGEAEPLLHPERVAAEPAVRGGAEPDPFQRGVHGGRDRPRREQRLGGRDPPQVLPAGEERVEPRALHQRPDVRAARAATDSGIGRPSSSTVPAVGRVRPSSIRISVVLPEPLGPSMPSTAPSGMSRSTLPSHRHGAVGRRPCAARGPGRRRPPCPGRGRAARVTAASASVSTCSGTAPAATRPSSVMIADPTAVVISRPLPQAPLTGVPIDDRSGAGRVRPSPGSCPRACA